MAVQEELKVLSCKQKKKKVSFCVDTHQGNCGDHSQGLKEFLSRIVGRGGL